MFAHNVHAYIATRKWRVLKVIPQVATQGGAESAVYDCFVYVCGQHYRRENQLEVDGKQVDEECLRLSSNVSTSSQVK